MATVKSNKVIKIKTPAPKGTPKAGAVVKEVDVQVEVKTPPKAVKTTPKKPATKVKVNKPKVKDKSIPAKVAPKTIPVKVLKETIGAALEDHPTSVFIPDERVVVPPVKTFTHIMPSLDLSEKDDRKEVEGDPPSVKEGPPFAIDDVAKSPRYKPETKEETKERSLSMQELRHQMAMKANTRMTDDRDTKAPLLREEPVKTPEGKLDMKAVKEHIQRVLATPFKRS